MAGKIERAKRRKGEQRELLLHQTSSSSINNNDPQRLRRRQWLLAQWLSTSTITYHNCPRHPAGFTPTSPLLRLLLRVSWHPRIVQHLHVMLPP